MDQIQAMRIFVRVVEAGTFTRAADSLSLPKATVTKHVQALEERLRVKLLNRTTRRVTVTPDGAAYYDRTVRLLTDLDDIEASMTNARANPRGRLRIDVGTSVAQLLIIPNLAEFHARYPDIQVDLGVSDRIVDLIGDNVDCVIRGGELSDQSLVARRVGNLEFITVASPDYLARKGTPTHPLEIEEKHASVIYFSPQSGRHYPLEFVKGSESIDITGPYQLSVNEANAYVTSSDVRTGGVGYRADHQLPGATTPAKWRPGAADARVDPAATACVRGVSTQPPPERQGACVCGLGGRAVSTRDPPATHAVKAFHKGGQGPLCLGP